MQQLKRARSSSALGHGKRQRQWPAPDRRGLVIFFLLLACPVLYTVSHMALLVRGGGGAPAAPQASLCPGQAAAGWPLLDSLHDLRYQRAALEVERDRLLLPGIPYSQWQPGGAPLPVFLFIGAFSAAPDRAKRDAVRDAWLTAANTRPEVVARFFVTVDREGEEADGLRAEAKRYGDVVLLGVEQQAAAQQGNAAAPTPEGEADGEAARSRKGGRALASKKGSSGSSKSSSSSSSSGGGKQQKKQQKKPRAGGKGSDGAARQQRIYSMLQHALAEHGEAAFVMKTEDSAFVNVGGLLRELKANCRNPGCKTERMYFGREVRSGKGGKRDKRSAAAAASAAGDADWSAHTSLRDYVPFMLGGGFVLSSDLAEVILQINTQEDERDGFLKFLSSEEVSVGVWLMSVDLRRINHPGVVSLGLGQDGGEEGCCFKSTLTKEGGGKPAVPLTLRPTVDICARLYLVLHPILHGAEMRHLANRLAQCREQSRLEDAARAQAVAASERLIAALPRPDGILAAAAAAEAQPSDRWPPPGEVLQLGSEEGGAAAGISGAAPSQVLLAAAAAGGWSADGKALLLLSLPEGSGPMRLGGRLQLGVLARSSRDERWGWQALEPVSAWGPARGPHAQWLGATRRFIVFNDRRCNGSVASPAGGALAAAALPLAAESAATCAVVYDLERMARIKVLQRPVFSVSPDGITAAALSFERLAAAEEGAGYGPADQAGPLQPCPAGDGLWLVDTPSGEARLLAPLAELAAAVAAAHGPVPPTPKCMHWVDGPVFGPAGDLLAFFYRVGRCGGAANATAAAQQEGETQNHLFLARHSKAERKSRGKSGGMQAWYVPLPFTGVISVSFARAGGSLLVCGGSTAFDVSLRAAAAAGLSPVVNVTHLRVPNAATRKGSLAHCSYDPSTDRRVLLVAEAAAEAPGGAFPRSLMLWDRWGGAVEGIARHVPSAEGLRGLAAHAGLAPQWSPGGGAIAFASSHSGQGWQVYLAGISAAAPPPARGKGGEAPSKAAAEPRPSGKRRKRRRVYIDLGAGDGDSITYFFGFRSNSRAYEIHAFEPDPNLAPGLKTLLAAARKKAQRGAPPPQLHRVAAWVADGEVGLHLGKAGTSGSRAGILRSLWRPSKEGASGTMFLPGQPAVNGSAASAAAAASAAGLKPPLAVPAVDFSAWLQRQVAPEDFVALRMDVAGAEFDLLPKLLLDGALALVDELEVVWGDELRGQYAEWPAVYRRLLAAAGVSPPGESGEPRG